MQAMPANSVDLIATDPPYYKVKGDAWDNQWDTPEAFLAWFDLIAEQWQRILRPNGSLYACASPQMGARVELLLGERFSVLNNITWRKEEGRHKAACKEELRGFFPASERIIFPTVARYTDKHPCEKPLAMMEHIVTASSRPGAVVLDCFMGSGATGEAALRLGRKFIGIEADAGYFRGASERLENVIDPRQRSLF